MLYEKSRKRATSKFWAAVKGFVKDINGLAPGMNVLFIDKNHPPNVMKKTAAIVGKERDQRVLIKVMALIPECLH